MKKLIPVILLFVCSHGMAQDTDTTIFSTTTTILPITSIIPSGDWTFNPYPFGNQKVISTYDTTLLFKGIDTVSHNHNYLSENILPFSFSSCAVLHDAAGCPDAWGNFDIICEVCLRNCNVKESRRVEKVINPYQLAKDRLNKIKQK